MQYITVFLVSGAGNDAVDYGLGLNDDCDGATTPQECVDEDGLRTLVKELTKSMSLLLHEVLWAFDAQQRMPIVVLHGYDYPVPDGRPFALLNIPFTGPWLATAMDARSVPADLELRKGIVRILIERINDAVRAGTRGARAGSTSSTARDCLSSGPATSATGRTSCIRRERIRPYRRCAVDPLFQRLGIARTERLALRLAFAGRAAR
jgi:hypothetical protein